MKQSEWTPYLDLLKASPLFQGISETDFPKALTYLRARRQAFSEGEIILHTGDPFHHAGLVLSGTMEATIQTENSDTINMYHFRTGEMFGMALVCAGPMASPVQLRALTDCTLLFLELPVLYEPSKCPYQPRLSANLIRCLSRQNRFLNQKVRILSHRALRDRVLVYLRDLPQSTDGTRQIPFSQTALAEFLGVNRSALARELGRMQDEGLISLEGRTVTLKKHNP